MQLQATLGKQISSFATDAFEEPMTQIITSQNHGLALAIFHFPTERVESPAKTIMT